MRYHCVKEIVRVRMRKLCFKRRPATLNMPRDIVNHNKSVSNDRDQKQILSPDIDQKYLIVLLLHDIFDVEFFILQLTDASVVIANNSL